LLLDLGETVDEVGVDRSQSGCCAGQRATEGTRRKLL
jgi:hypothetical protein